MITLNTSFQLLSETYVGNNGYGNIYIRTYGRVSSTGYDIPNNRTKVYVKSTLVSNGSYFYSGSGTTKSLACTGLPSVSAEANGNYPEGETTLCETNGYVTHNNDGTKSIYITANFTSSSWGWNANTEASAILPTIPRQANITSAPNFTDEDNPTITYSNPAGNNVSSLQACIAVGEALSRANIPYRDIPKTGNSYTFNFTDEERATLKQLCTGTSCTVRYHIKTVVGGNTFYSTLDRTLTKHPTITSFYISDKTFNSLTVTYNYDINCDMTQYAYKLESDESYSEWINVIGKTYVIPNLSPYTKYDIKMKIRANNSGLWTESNPILATTKGGVVRIKKDGSYKNGIVYYKHNGTWGIGIIYIKKDGVWKTGQ